MSKEQGNDIFVIPTSPRLGETASNLTVDEYSNASVRDDDRTITTDGDAITSASQVTRETDKKEEKTVEDVWSVVVAVSCLLILVFTLGIGLSVAPLVVEWLQIFGEGQEKTGWVGSINLALVHFCGPLSSTVSQVLGFRMTIILGASIASIGLVSSAFVTSINWLYFTYGIVAGATSVMVRLLLGLIGKWFHLDVIGLYIMGSILQGVSMFLLPQKASIFWYSALWCLAGGTGYGICVGMFVSVLMEVLPSELAVAGFGIAMMTAGFGALGGPPLAGKFHETFGNYVIAFYFGGSCLILSGILQMIIWWHQHTKKRLNVIDCDQQI